MEYEVLPHTADLRIRARGRTLEELFRSALAGMGAVMQPAAATRPSALERPIALTAPDAATLLVDFLSEALALAHVHREVYSDARFQELSSTTLRATLQGIPVGGFARDVKAATYHEVEVIPTPYGHEATVVFDV
jgi:SHS2 domain-containing protein